MKRNLANWLAVMSHGKYADLGLLILRIAVGSIMSVYHGWQKFKHFDEYSKDFYNFLGLGNAFSLGLATFAEFLCGLLVVIGLLTRLATIPLLITMGVIVFDLNAGNELYKFETPLLYMVSFLVLLITGAGKYSLDYKFFYNKGTT